MGQWNVDINGYYNDVNAKYVTYRDNSQGHFFKDGKHTLTNGPAISAIAQILNRTLILPKFQRNKYVHCPLNCFILIRNFDPNFDYRESEFLNHQLVPTNIRNSTAIYEVHMADALFNITIIFTNKEDQIWFDKRVKMGWYVTNTTSYHINS